MAYYGLSDRDRKEGHFNTVKDRVSRGLIKEIDDAEKKLVSLKRRLSANEARVFEVEFMGDSSSAP